LNAEVAILLLQQTSFEICIPLLYGNWHGQFASFLLLNNPNIMIYSLVGSVKSLHDEAEYLGKSQKWNCCKGQTL
jgi:hypothetical protein